MFLRHAQTRCRSHISLPEPCSSAYVACKALRVLPSECALGARAHGGLSTGSCGLQPAPLWAGLLSERSRGAPGASSDREMCWVCQPVPEPALPSRAKIQESRATGGGSVWSSSRCQVRRELPRQTGSCGWVPEEGKGIAAGGEQPVPVWMLLAGTGQALGKSHFRNWLPSAFSLMKLGSAGTDWESSQGCVNRHRSWSEDF